MIEEIPNSLCATTTCYIIHALDVENLEGHLVFTDIFTVNKVFFNEVSFEFFFYATGDGQKKKKLKGFFHIKILHYGKQKRHHAPPSIHTLSAIKTVRSNFMLPSLC
jgi:hypothetical protein